MGLATEEIHDQTSIMKMGGLGAHPATLFFVLRHDMHCIMLQHKSYNKEIHAWNSTRKPQEIKTGSHLVVRPNKKQADHEQPASYTSSRALPLYADEP